MITDGHNPFTVMLFVGAVLMAFALAATYAVAQNALTVASFARICQRCVWSRLDRPLADQARHAHTKGREVDWGHDPPHHTSRFVHESPVCR